MTNAASPLPKRAGIGLKPVHFQEILEREPDIGFFEIHAENFMVPGGPLHHDLLRIRDKYPLSIHGVGLSIGGEEPLNREHLIRLARLLDRYQPAVFSEHLAWSGHAGLYASDLLPLPYHEGTLQRVCEHIDLVQTRLKRRILLENPATYVEFCSSTMREGAFLSEVVRRTGCGLLLDVNNLFVSCFNHGLKPLQALNELPCQAVGEIHLAGFARDTSGMPDPGHADDVGPLLLIDSHGAHVDAQVWQLYDEALRLTGDQPTLVEWDHNLPTLEVWLAEASLAQNRLQAHGRAVFWQAGQR